MPKNFLWLAIAAATGTIIVGVLKKQGALNFLD